MKAPSISTAIAGHPVVALLVYLMTGGALLAAFLGRTDFTFPVIMLFVAGGVSRCADHVEKYRLWKLEWNAMGQTPPRPQGPVIGLLSLFGGAAIWLGLIWLLFTIYLPNLAWLRNIVVGAAALLLIMWFFHRVKPKRPSPNLSDPPVADCLPIPTHSPPAASTLALVPAYCQPILERPR